MQLLLLGLALVVFLHDAPEAAGLRVALPAWATLGVVLLPKLAVGVGYWAWCAAVRRRLGTPGGLRSLNRLNRGAAVLPIVALGLYVIDLWAGALDAVRGSVVGGQRVGLAPRDTILLDELAVMLPTLGLVVFSWWAYGPIDRRLREASLIRRADAGLPIYPVWGRGRYVWMQARFQLGLILVPLLLILAWSESVVRLAGAGVVSDGAALWLMPVGAGLVFVAAPLVVRRLWDTVPLPAGPTRDRLVAVCERHGVRVRGLLLWRSFGGMINAAVVGLFGPLRYILLSDGLLDQVKQPQVEAVLAHELGHVKLRHLAWLAAAALALGVTLSGLGEWALGGVSEPWVLAAAAAAGLVAWAAGFGWVSRRVERQADTFAVRHVAEASADPDGEPPRHFDAASVAVMVDALQSVAVLNHVPPTRRSWRHGSIAWRQAYLRTLVGTPLDHAPIDRLMQGVNAAVAAVLAAGLAWATLG
ncbi:MAG: M48 family metallopeptidase [Planctomycetota bacterium]